MAKRSPEDSPKLRRYRVKRDPAGTNEPFGPEPVRSEGTFRGSFVVHLHAARRLHYDLRIEVGGVLKSFPVPKGPSLDPTDKRLAIETEDHPLGYLDFEGVIPEGNYGAGPMIVWDTGTLYYLERSAEVGLADGKLDFQLFGRKLKGRFALVRTGSTKRRRKPEPPQWLLLKKTDAFCEVPSTLLESRPHSVLSGLTVEELPRRSQLAHEVCVEAEQVGAPLGEVSAERLTPMRCRESGAPLRDSRWIYELKLDGARLLAQRRSDQVTLFYRSGRSATRSYPELIKALRSMAPRSFVLDGEVVAFDEHGLPRFEHLANRIHAGRSPKALFSSHLLTYAVFDLLEVEGRDLRRLPLRTRKRLLRSVVRADGVVRVLDHLEEDGTALMTFCEAHDLEGIIAKRADSPYEPGPHRSTAWVKLRREREEDFVVAGWTRGRGSRKRLGALDLASYEGGRLVVRGKVGTGLGTHAIDVLLESLTPLVVSDAAAEGEFEHAPHGRLFVRPEVVVRVKFGGWTDEGRLRFPVFVRVCEDAVPQDCDARPPQQEGATLEESQEDAPLNALPGQFRRAVLSNQQKVFWPDEGYTKGDLCAYYATVAPTLLPYLRDRPVVLVRYPDGISGKHFFQWNTPKHTPSWMRRVTLRRDGREVEAFLIDDVDGLLFIANLGCIPIHILAGRAESLETCDFLTVDFDVGEASLAEAVALARGLHELLAEVELPGFAKTSGQTGLHVLVPMGPNRSFESARLLAELLGRLLVSRFGQIGTLERLKNKRRGRVLIDVGQTGPSRTIVAPYSVRAYPGATVSTPLEWDEVGFALDPKVFTIETVPQRLARYRDPMGELLEVAPDIDASVERLAELARGG